MHKATNPLNRMEVFTIDFSLNLMQPFIILTHVTTCNSEFMDFSILNLLHINTLVCDFEISTQRFRSLAIKGWTKLIQYQI